MPLTSEQLRILSEVATISPWAMARADNATLGELAELGLVVSEPVPGTDVYLHWMLTQAGVDALAETGP